MTQKTTLWIAAALTAFVLFIGGAVAGIINQPQQTAQASATADLEALLVQREAEYKALIDQANTQLAEAYRNQQTVSMPETMDQSTFVPPTDWITTEQAMSAAVINVPGARILRLPEMVDFQGTVAYEVSLDKGMVYIDASNGTLLYNAATEQATMNSQPQGSNSYQDDDHDDNHDDEDDHDD